MKIFLLLCVFVHCSTFISCENKYSTNQSCTKDSKGEEHCTIKDEFEEEEEDEPSFYNDDEEEKEVEKEVEKENLEKKWEGKERLFQWDPVEVGHKRSIEVAPGQTITMVTAALKPKVFTIDNFLTDFECDHVINKALNNGMFDSGLHIDPETRKNRQYTKGSATSSVGDYRQWDRNSDGKITISEVKRMAEKLVKLYINETDIHEMLSILKMNELDDDIITPEEFKTMNTASVAQYMNLLREENPRFRDRFSEQIWLRQGEYSDRVMQGLRKKVYKLTNLPQYIVDGGEALQVLRYQPFGHYHAHFDSQDATAHTDKKICCHMEVEANPDTCRLCRFITIIYYLNDVEEGGETAFPAADDPNYDHEEFRQRREDDLYNLSKFCHTSRLVVKPKKGRAVMWYNHHMDKDGWLGDMDYWSLHGGCDIIKGTKWMANNWLPAPPGELVDTDSLYLNFDAPGAY